MKVGHLRHRHAHLSSGAAGRARFSAPCSPLPTPTRSPSFFPAPAGSWIIFRNSGANSFQTSQRKGISWLACESATLHLARSQACLGRPPNLAFEAGRPVAGPSERGNKHALRVNLPEFWHTYSATPPTSGR